MQILFFVMFSLGPKYGWRHNWEYLISFPLFFCFWMAIKYEKARFSTASFTMDEMFLFGMFSISWKVLLMSNYFNVLLISDTQSPLEGNLIWVFSFWMSICFKYIIFLCLITNLAGIIPSSRYKRCLGAMHCVFKKIS